MKRITVIMPDEVYDKVIALAKKEKRSKSAMSSILIEDGLKLVTNEQTKAYMKHAQYYQNIANGIARINQCIFACKLATVETGTFYSKRFKK